MNLLAAWGCPTAYLFLISLIVCSHGPTQTQAARAAALEAEAAEAELRGALITYNLAAVDAAIAALNESLASGGPVLCAVGSPGVFLA